MEQSLLDQKLEKWRSQLIDLTKRNKLLSYKSTAKTVRIPASLNQLYKDLLNEKSIPFQRYFDFRKDLTKDRLFLLDDSHEFEIPDYLHKYMVEFLAKLIRSHGLGIVADPERVGILLHKRFEDFPDMVNSIVQLSRIGMLDRLIKAEKEIDVVDIDQWMKEQKNQSAAQSFYMRWSLTCWMDVLGKKLLEGEESRAAKEIESKVQQEVEKFEKDLNKIRLDALNVMKEQGVNVLYIAFGFLKWHEPGKKQEVWKSPLLLLPVELKKERGNTFHSIRALEEDLIFNPVLLQKLKVTFDLHLADFTETEGLKEGSSVTNIIEFYKEALKGRPSWGMEESAYLDLFSFNKISMYKEFETYRSLYYQHPIIKQIGGAAVENEEDREKTISIEEFDRKEPPEHSYQIVDADSSQQQAILAARKEQSFIMQGPPGTGKSQTITNIIAELLGEGKTVLFVSEKAAALEVVKSRLEEKNIGDFCLELHSNKTNKKAIIEELGRVLRLSKTRKAEEISYKTYGDIKHTLDEYVSELHETRGTIRMSLFEAYGMLSSLNHLPNLTFSVPDINHQYSTSDFEETKLFLNHLNTVKSLFTKQHYIKLWRDHQLKELTYRMEENIILHFSQLKEQLSEIIRFLKESDYLLSFNEKMTPMQLRKLFDLLEHLKTKPYLVENWFYEDYSGISLEAKQKSNDYQKLKDIVQLKYDSSIFTLDVKQLEEDLLDKYVTSLQSFGLSVREFGSVFFQNDEQMLHLIKRITSSIKELLAGYQWAEENLGIVEANPDLNHMKFIAEFLSELKEVKFQPTLHWFQSENRNTVLQQFEAAFKMTTRYKEAKSKLTEVYDSSVIHLELKELDERFNIKYPQYFRSLDALKEFWENDERAMEIIHKMSSSLSDLYDFIQEFSRHFNLPRPLFTIDQLKFLVELYETILQIKCEPTQEWFDRGMKRKLESDLHHARQIHEEYQKQKEELTNHYGESIINLEVEPIEERLNKEYPTYFKNIESLEHVWNSNSEVIESIIQAVDLIEELQTYEKEANETLGMGSLIFTPKKVKEIAQLYEAMNKVKCWPTAHWFDPLERSKILQYMTTGKEKSTSYKDRMVKLQERYDAAVLQLEVMEMQKRFIAEYHSLSSIFKKQYRNDVKLLKAHQKEGVKTNFNEYVRDITLMTEINKDKEWLNQDILQEWLGLDFRGEQTGWEEIKESVEAVIEICGLLASLGVHTNEIQHFYSHLLMQGTVLQTFNQSVRNKHNRMIQALEILEQIIGNVSNDLHLSPLVEYTNLDDVLQWLNHFLSVTDQYRADVTVFQKQGSFVHQPYAQYLKEISLIKQVQHHRIWLDKEKEHLLRVFGNGYQELNTDWEMLYNSMQSVFTVCERLSDEGIPIRRMSEKVMFERDKLSSYSLKNMKDYLSHVLEHFDRVQEKLSLPSITETDDLIVLLEGLNQVIAATKQYKTDQTYFQQFSKSIRNYDQVISDLNLIKTVQYLQEMIQSKKEDWKDTLGVDIDSVSINWDLLKGSLESFFKLYDALQEKGLSTHSLYTFLCLEPFQPIKIAEKESHLVKALNQLEVNLALFDHYVMQMKGHFDKQQLINIHEWSTKIENIMMEWLDIRSSIMQYSISDGSSCTFNQLIEVIDKVKQVKEIEAFIEQNDPFYQTVFGEMYHGVNTNWEAVTESIKWVEMLKDYVEGELSEKLIDSLMNESNDYEYLLNNLFRVKQTWDESKEAREFLGYVFPINKRLFSGEQFNHAPLEEIIAQLHQWAKRIDELKRLFELNQLQQKAKSLGLSSFVDQLLEAPASSYHQYSYVDLFLKQFYIRLIEYIHKETPYLAHFSLKNHQNTIENFRSLDINYIHSNQDRLYNVLKKRKSTFVAMKQALPERQVLERELQKNRSHKPIRLLFSEIPNLVQHLKPCMMMSPLSVSEFIDVERMQFDVVIFDEASQVRSEDAIGSILRGKQLIVAGDRKQLPPSSFFSGIGQKDDHAGGDDEIYESILDECSMFLKSEPLQWHYRSRHESLIAFSNHYIYNDELITFPSAFHDKRNGVSLVYVEDGIYDRGRSGTNKREAETVVELVLEHAKHSPERSLGVIAFNVKQEEAIRAELERQMKNNRQYGEFFDEEKEEAFFIKNLENSQGEERDTIIFSIGFGKAADGSIHYNFGPLTQAGGERRLNVAITRAKYEIKVVSSILDKDLEDKKLKSQGPILLKKYLSYAESKGQLVRASNHNGSSSREDRLSSLEQDILAELEGKGYKVIKKIGNSEFKVDLAIVDPHDDQRILLGIMTDGEIYRRGKTVRDRERLRPNVLENLGWNIYRVFAPAWQRNKGEELQKMMNLIKESGKKKPQKVPVS
ncbi:DUF4011 domain-containing protein [Niallia endozanthoxylica]|nr:DUF4011 domain-containing protein [Niallia endozanthoxylica]